MIVLLIIIVILFVVLVFVSKRKVIGIPLLSGAWPVLGHIPMLLVDNIKLYKLVDKITRESFQNGGSVCVSVGVANFYSKYVVFTDPDDCFAILNASVEKHYIHNLAKPWLGEGLIIAEPKIWQVKKKLLHPMFKQQNLSQFLTVFNKQGRRLVKQFSEHVGKGAFNHESHVLCITLETICYIILGSDAAELIARKKIVDTIEDVMDYLIKRVTRIWLSLQPIFEISNTKRELDKCVEILNEFSYQLLQQRKTQLKRASRVEESDTEAFIPFLDTLINISENNKEFDDKKVVDEIKNLIIAGYDAKANTLLFALMLLGHHQDIQDKIYKESIEVFGNIDRDLDKYDLTKVVYLEAFIKEVTRLYSSGPIVARNAPTDIKLKNCTIPAGTNCFISLYGLHRNPEWGIDAEVFNPDRWLNPDTMPKNPNLYAPFGMGKRYCVGKTFAMMSLKTTLTHVVRNYRIKADMNNLVIQLMILIKPAFGQHISLMPRN